MHVAADSTNLGISGPINEHGEFDYIPLGPEGRDSTEKLTYNGLGLSSVIPAKYDGLTPHYDPNPAHFVYGEPPNKGRGKQLLKLRPGDYFFMVASLAPVRKETYAIRTRTAISADQRGRMAKYVIGWYEVAAILRVNKSSTNRSFSAVDGSKYVSAKMDEQVRQNAHFKRSKDTFVCAVGTKDGRESCLLRKAIQLTRPGAPFEPNQLGLSLYGNKTFPRGWTWIPEDKVRLLLSQIQNQ